MQNLLPLGGATGTVKRGKNMNKIRRNKLDRIRRQLEKVLDDLEAVQAEEEDCLDSTPEGLQNTERYEQSEIACGCLIEAAERLEAAINAINDATM